MRNKGHPQLGITEEGGRQPVNTLRNKIQAHINVAKPSNNLRKCLENTYITSIARFSWEEATESQLDMFWNFMSTYRICTTHKASINL